MLAVVGTDNNIAVYDANGKNPIAITSDAQLNQVIYHWPTWATDGRLAFFGVSNIPTNSYSLGVFVVDQIKAGATIRAAYDSPDDVFTYAYWSPGDCPAQTSTPASTSAVFTETPISAKPNCRDLALLYTPGQGQGLGLRLIQEQNGKFTDRFVDYAAPFYYSFSPDGSQILWVQSASKIGIYDIEAGKQVKTLDDVPGQFNAPMWSPTDSRLLFGRQSSDGQKTDIVIAEGDKRQVLLQNQDSPVSFAWSPDSKLVASVAGFGKLVVTDSSTGNVVASADQANVVAHFWSPQSDRVAYVVAGQNPPPIEARLVRSNGHQSSQLPVGGLAWYILDVKTGQSQLLAHFDPSRDMAYYLSFFDQFARSHNLWSPDGRFLAYSATDLAGHPSVYLLDTHGNGSPMRVAAGSFGVWSWN